MGQKKNDRRAWPTGVVTADMVEKDVKGGGLLQAAVYSVGTLAMGAVTAPVLLSATDLTLKLAALLLATGIFLVLAVREWMSMFTKLEYRVETDRILRKEMQLTYEDKDAERIGLATKLPVLHLEKQGSWRLEADKIHRGYTDLELYHVLEEGETVYLIYSQRTNKLLRLYRAQYWQLPTE